MAATHRQNNPKHGSLVRSWPAVTWLAALATGCGGSPAASGREQPDPNDTILTPSSLLINEIASSNRTGFEDEFGESPDWIELYNSGTEPINLAGYSLSDNANNPRRWAFGDISIAAGQYLVVAASGRDIRSLDRAVPAEYHGLSTFVWSWADGKNDPPGGSYVNPDLFEGKIYGALDGKTVISARVYLADNTGTLNWSAAIIHHGWAGWDGTTFSDFSAYNRAYLEATLPAGTAYELHLCQASADCGEGYILQLTGNGVANYRYPVPIVGDLEGLDLSKLNGFQLRPVTTGIEAQVLVTDFAFSHGGYYLHANFALAKTGETLTLSNAEGKALDRRKVPLLKTDASYGRSATEQDQWVVFAQPTPGAPNAGAEYQGVCPKPTFSAPPGMYASPLSITALASEACQVHVTVDGKTPTRDSTLLEGALPIGQTTLVQATAAGPEWLESEVVTDTYFVAEQHDLPVVSIATEPSLLFDPVTGIYELGPLANPESPHQGANFWKDIEIPAYVQFFEPTGKLGFESGVGLSIFGNYSRANPEKSLAIAFRGEYGLSTLNYTLFPDRPTLTTFDDFVLRNSGNDFGKTMFRDALGSSLCDTMGLDYQAYRPSVVYINGQYWGLHNIREKMNADYILTHYALNDTEFDLLRPGESAQVGSATEWEALTAKLEAEGAATETAYAAVASQIDIDNFIDFNCAEIYDGNTDWPGNNVKWWKAHGPDGRWRWLIYDMDLGFRDPQVDILAQTTTINSSWPNPTWSTLVLRKLLENAAFRAHFIARCAIRLDTNFATARVLDRIESMAQAIENEIPRFFTRWSLDPAKWPVEVNKLRSFAQLRPDAVRQHFATYFQLPGTVKLTIDPGVGSVIIDGVRFTGAPTTLTVFASSPLALQALAPDGRVFRGYSDGATDASRSLTLTADTALSLTFE